MRWTGNSRVCIGSVCAYGNRDNALCLVEVCGGRRIYESCDAVAEPCATLGCLGCFGVLIMVRYRRWRNREGQSTVEAAFLIPVVFVCLLVLIQPSILLVNRLTMESAAYEGCRYALTCVEGEGDGDAVKLFVERRLRIFPRTKVVHCPPWDIEVMRDYENHEVTIRISHALEPLPLIGSEILLWNGRQADGLYHQEVEVTKKLRGNWMSGRSEDPSGWIERWEEAV